MDFWRCNGRPTRRLKLIPEIFIRQAGKGLFVHHLPIPVDIQGLEESHHLMLPHVVPDPRHHGDQLPLLDGPVVVQVHQPRSSMQKIRRLVRQRPVAQAPRHQILKLVKIKLLVPVHIKCLDHTLDLVNGHGLADGLHHHGDLVGLQGAVAVVVDLRENGLHLLVPPRGFFDAAGVEDVAENEVVGGVANGEVGEDLGSRAAPVVRHPHVRDEAPGHGSSLKQGISHVVRSLEFPQAETLWAVPIPLLLENQFLELHGVPL
mmetsp:Transcript_130854/g.298003  ORF Transcript_130854/g.298003 Transcript_130854/m.298003 type:complete len:261 (+) Transcript_130854:409-1191(+)